MRASAEQPQLAVRPPAEGDVVIRHEAAQRLICAAGIPLGARTHLHKCEIRGLQVRSIKHTSALDWPGQDLLGLPDQVLLEVLQ